MPLRPCQELNITSISSSRQQLLATIAAMSWQCSLRNDSTVAPALVPYLNHSLPSLYKTMLVLVRPTLRTDFSEEMRASSSVTLVKASVEMAATSGKHLQDPDSRSLAYGITTDGTAGPESLEPLRSCSQSPEF